METIMRLTTPSILHNNINFKEHDALQREEFGNSLLNLITRTNEELVICLDAPWGEGKTTFVKMWQNLIKENDIYSIYFDAFANDYIDDAFIAIASHMVTFIEQELDKNNPARKKIKDFKKMINQVGIPLLSWSAKIGLKAATLGVIKDNDIEELTDIKNDIAKGTSNVVSKFIEERINLHKEETQTIKTFRRTLEEFAKDIYINSEKPLVIIIDELDRCKPPYAIEIIEKIKHIFSVKKIVFLLVMHKNQLEGAIKSVYGAEIDATTYLQKFININCTLPKNKDIGYSNDYTKYCTKLVELHELDIDNEKKKLIDSISLLAFHFDLSLRQLEKVFTNIAIFYAAASQNFLGLTPIISLLAVVRVINYNLYSKLKEKSINFSDLQDELHLPTTSIDNLKSEEMSRFVSWIQLCVLTDNEYINSDEKVKLDKMRTSLCAYGLAREEIIPLYCNKFDMFKTN